MKVLVTGATGFLGSHLIKALLKEKYDVIALKRSFSNTRRIDEVLDQVTTYNIDQCALEFPFKEQGHIDAIIHTATCYGRKNESIVKIHDTNTNFPLKLLETAVQFNTKTFFNTDTILEKDVNTYALSKKQFVEWGKTFTNARKIQFINLKLEHIYGPDDDESKFVTYIINSCLNNVPVLDLTKGEQQRDFIYIDDVVSAYMILLKQYHEEKAAFGEYEIGSGETISIKDFVLMVHKLTRSKTKLNFGAVPYRENEMMETKANTWLLNKLGWGSKNTVQSGIRKVVEQR